MKKLLFLLFFILLLSFGIFLTPSSKAQDAMCNNPANLSYDDLGKCVDELSSARQQSINATKPLQDEINGIKQRIAVIENDLAVKQKNIEDGYANLAKQQQILNATIRDYYIKSYYNSPLLILLSANSASELTQILGYQKSNADRDKAIITNIAITINDLKTQKSALQDEETSISATKAKLDVIVNGAVAYQNTLANQIAQFSALQEQLLAQKYSSLGIPLTAYTSNKGCSSDITPYKDPGFSGTKFGFFTYGVYHRVGMNQYGAKGRADKGASYQSILGFYYPNTQLANVNTSVSITVDGTNDYGETFSNQQFSSVEDYLTHIYEMPATGSNTFPTEALKAQAVAARTYAMQSISGGHTTVAPNQSFQEVKTEQNSQNWIDAVNATSGQILESGGSPITAWFSSTAGGYTHNSGDVFGSSTNYTTTAADTNGSANSFSDLQNNAYDGPNYANSPWFYCDWGGRSGYNNTAWLQSNEVADIVNVIMLVQADSSTAPHLSQPDGNIPDTWNPDRVKQELQNRKITPFNNISNISVSPDFGAGKTSNVSVNGDAGSKSFSGDTFATYFDVRAPANIFIPCLKYNSDHTCAAAPLFNVEQR
jgi:SpoIID/LytB domain protein